MKSQTKLPVQADQLPQTSIAELSWENLLARREAVLSVIEELEAEKKILDEEFVIRLEQEHLTGKIVGDQNISLITTYSCEKDQARLFGAITRVISERVNTGIIKELHNKGIEIKGLTITKRPMIREVKKNE